MVSWLTEKWCDILNCQILTEVVTYISFVLILNHLRRDGGERIEEGGEREKKKEKNHII